MPGSPNHPVDMPDVRARLIELGLTEDREFLAESIVAFRESVEDQIAALRAAGADSSALERASHRLAGAALNFGAQRLGALCRDLEHQVAAAALSSAAIGPRLSEIEHEAESLFAFCSTLV